MLATVHNTWFLSVVVVVTASLLACRTGQPTVEAAASEHSQRDIGDADTGDERADPHPKRADHRSGGGDGEPAPGREEEQQDRDRHQEGRGGAVHVRRVQPVEQGLLVRESRVADTEVDDRQREEHDLRGDGGDPREPAPAAQPVGEDQQEHRRHHAEDGRADTPEPQFEQSAPAVEGGRVGRAQLTDLGEGPRHAAEQFAEHRERSDRVR